MEINLMIDDKALTFKNCTLSDDGDCVVGQNNEYRVVMYLIPNRGPFIKITSKRDKEVETHEG